MSKYVPKVGDKLYLSSSTNNYWVDSVRDPYTVIEVKGNICMVQECKLIFKGIRYFDTLPDRIEEDKNGRVKKLRWSSKKERWQETPAGSYPQIAHFGSWDYAPYLN